MNIIKVRQKVTDLKLDSNERTNDHIRQIYERYPFVGVFKFAKERKDYGEIEPYFAHISARYFYQSGTTELEDPHEKNVLYNAGVNPFDPKKRTQPCVILWATEEELNIQSNAYLAGRCEYLSILTNEAFLILLKAEWYSDKFPPKQRHLAKLECDKALHDEVVKRLKETNESTFFVRLFLESIGSPAIGEVSYYDMLLVLGKFMEHLNPNDFSTIIKKMRLATSSATTKKRIDEICKSYIQCSTKNIPDHKWLARQEQCLRISAEDELGFTDETRKLYLTNHLREMAPYYIQAIDEYGAQTIRRFLTSKVDVQDRDIFKESFTHLFIKSAIAVDLESNGKEIFQLGWHEEGKGATQNDFRNDEGTRVLKVIDDLAKSILENERWIIGHNLIEWDLPILYEHASDNAKTTFDLQQRYVWDTMLSSIVLTPWKPTHALISATHQADQDAQATFDLFKEQLVSLGPQVKGFLFNQSTEKPVCQWLELLAQSESIAWCQPPDFLSQTKVRRLYVPKHWLQKVAWVSNVTYAFPRGHIAEEDYEIERGDSEKWIRANGKDQDVPHRVLTSLLFRAEQRNVRVRVGMLPLWLYKKCKTCITAVAKPFNDTSPIIGWIVSTYESHITTNTDIPRDDGTTIKWIEPHFVALFNAQATIIEVSQAEVKSLLNENVLLEKGYALYEKPKGSFTQWIELHPSRDNGLTWNSMPTGDEMPDQVTSFKGRFNRPIWVDSKTGMPVGVDSLWPTSTNRYAYWMDTLQKIISLFQSMQSNQHLLVIVLERGRESTLIQNILIEMKLAWPEQTPSAEVIRKAQKEKCCVVTDEDSVSKWLQLQSEDPAIKFEYVIPALPLELWLLIFPK